MNLIDPPHDIKNLNTVLWWQGTHISFIGEKSITESLISDFCTWIKGMSYKKKFNFSDNYNGSNIIK